MPFFDYQSKKTIIRLAVGVVAFTAAVILWMACSGRVLAAADTQGASQEAELRAVYQQLQAGKRIIPDTVLPATGKPEEPTVYLTFDDGPSKYTPQVLDILRDEDVLATFFELGNQIKEYPQYTKRVLEEGHALGNHTYNHVYNEVYSKSFEGFWDQITKTEEIINQTVGVKPRLIRAPGGTSTNFDAFYYYYLDLAGYRVVDWNVDSSDASRVGVPASEIVQAVKKTPLRQEMVVLMHDGTGHQETVKALPQIIHYFKEKGYRFALLTEQTNPSQFQVVKTKWNRSVSFADFSRTAKTMRELGGQYWEEQDVSSEADGGGSDGPRASDSGRHDGGRLYGGDSGGGRAPSGGNGGSSRQPGGMGGSAASGRLQPIIPLTLIIDGKPWTVEPERQDFSDGRFAVPLRELVERMGGQVLWDKTRLAAVVRCGSRTLEFDLTQKTLREWQPAAGWVEHRMADLRLVQGELRVSLRTVVEMLGSRIEGYSMGAGKAEVRITTAKGGIIRTPRTAFYSKKQ